MGVDNTLSFYLTCALRQRLSIHIVIASLWLRARWLNSRDYSNTFVIKPLPPFLIGKLILHGIECSICSYVDGKLWCFNKCSHEMYKWWCHWCPVKKVNSFSYIWHWHYLHILLIPNTIIGRRFLKGTLYQCESVKFGYNSTLEALDIFLNIPRTSL